MDRISNLPDEIICHVGSFLSAKDAAVATVLSKRWQNLFTIVPELRLYGENFMGFEDRVLALPVNSRVRKFSLGWVFKDSEHAYINRCLCHVLKRGVLVLDLEILYDDEKVYSLPLDVFTCNTVTELALSRGFAIAFLPTNAYLPSLKTLYLDLIRFYEFGPCAFHTLLSASPKLEELVIDGVEFDRWKWSFSVSSPTLQRLTIRRERWDDYDDESEFESIILDTPALTYLEYYDFVPKKYLFVNLNSLVEAKVDLFVPYEEKYDVDDFDPMNLINGLTNVEILDLDSKTMEMIYVFRKVVPVFENLFRLSVSISKNLWFSLPILLKKSPNLKTLIIKDYLYDNYPEREFVCKGMLSSPVEVLNIMIPYKGNNDELEQMKHLLEKLSCLELVEVRSWVKSEERVRVMDDLLMLPSTSTKCKINVSL